jgi:hypothetical protein
MTSTDGTTWTTNGGLITSSNLNSVTFGNSLFVVGGSGGILFTSTDALTWTSRTSNTSSNIQALTYGSVYVYAGAGGVVASSTDAITWTTRASTVSTSLTAATYTSGIYVLAGSNTILSSNDGTNWTSQASALTGAVTLQSAAANGNVFLLLSNLGIGETSPKTYTYNTETQFQVPTDNNTAITVELTTNFKRGLYIKAI